MRLCIVGDLSQGTKKPGAFRPAGFADRSAILIGFAALTGILVLVAAHLRRVALRMFAAFAASFGGFLGIICEVAPTLVAALLRIAIFVVCHRALLYRRRHQNAH
jgi:hypothetical protein